MELRKMELKDKILGNNLEVYLLKSLLNKFLLMLLIIYVKKAPHAFIQHQPNKDITNYFKGFLNIVEDQVKLYGFSWRKLRAKHYKNIQESKIKPY